MITLRRGLPATTVLFLALLLALPHASAPQPLRVLFIGNSLTAANDLPGMIEALADASGWRGTISCEQVTAGNFGLQEHWEQGDARRAIRGGRWTHIVLQQGPSSLPESQKILREYAARFASEARPTGAQIILYGVWPPRARLAFLPAVTEGYTNAAADVKGTVVPVGDGWAAAWKQDPALPLYAADDFHPSPAGTYLAAVMLFEAITGAQVPALSADALAKHRALRSVKLTPAQLAIVHAAATRRAPAGEAHVGRTIAITIDDLPTVSPLGEDIERAERTTRDLLSAIGRAKVPAIGFVNERKLLPSDPTHPRRVALLQAWLDAGLELGNHTFSHIDLHRTDPAAFTQDIARGDDVVTRLLAAKGMRPRYFRHPFLHTGRSAEVRKIVDTFLAEHGYTVAPVTIDNYDYLFAAAYDRALDAGDRELSKRVAAAYLDYMVAVIGYYEGQSTVILGREPAQTLLMHANALNASTIEALVDRFRQRGYRFVSLEDALKDPAYALADTYYGPAGMTWLHRWALTQGKKGSIFAGEPEVPEWIRKVGVR